MPKQDSNFRLYILKELAKDLRYLLNRGYHKKTSLNFLANRWQLSSLEREILTRAIFSRAEALSRKSKQASINEISGSHIFVDGHNVLITVESAIKGLPVFVCDDGFVRDASRLSRKFRGTATSINALHTITMALRRLPVARITVYFDAPLSKSGELAAKMRALLKRHGLFADVLAVPSADLYLRDAKIIATSDSALIDGVDKVFDLGAYAIKLIKIKPFRL